MKKTEIARKIESWMKKNDLLTDTRIYLNGKAWNYNSRGTKVVMENIHATDYLEYGNNDTISMSFEGGLYNVLNYAYDSKHYEKLQAEFYDILGDYGYYYELGNAWNLSLYEV